MVARRRIFLTAAGVGVATLGGLFVTGRYDDVLRAVGATPRPLPRPEDTSLMTAVVADQQQVLAVARGAGATEVVALVSAQLDQLGATPGRRQVSGDLTTTLRDAAGHRAADARAAISPEFAQVLASMSAGLTQAVVLAGGAA